jgi:hypothetical protein
MVVDADTRYSGPYPYVDGLIMQVTQRIGSIEVWHSPRPEGRSNDTMTVLLLVSGVQSMILGVLGEYVGRAFLSANGKPQGTVHGIQRNAIGGDLA